MRERQSYCAKGIELFWVPISERYRGESRLQNLYYFATKYDDYLCLRNYISKSSLLKNELRTKISYLNYRVLLENDYVQLFYYIYTS